MLTDIAAHVIGVFIIGLIWFSVTYIPYKIYTWNSMCADNNGWSMKILCFVLIPIALFNINRYLALRLLKKKDESHQ